MIVGVTLQLFTGCESGSGIAKRMKIGLWIPIQVRNHNTSSCDSRIFQPMQDIGERERERERERDVICRLHGVNHSGQTKQIFGRNTETETRPLGKAEV